MKRSNRLAGAGLVLAVLALAACGGPADDESYAEAMAREHEGDSPQTSPAARIEPGLPVQGAEVTYGEIDGTKLSGYLARPEDARGVAAGLLVIHEWWGLNDNIRALADRLAAEGYLALAVDLYGGEVADHPQQAREQMQRAMADAQAAEANLRRAYEYLTREQGVERVGTIGWCFGGGWSLRAALLLPEEIDATVIYYGRLVVDRDRLATLQMPILGLFGEQDGGIPVETVREFQSVLESLDKSVEIQVYPGADHAFANPSGTRYNAEAAEDAWKRTTEFLARNLQPQD